MALRQRVADVAKVNSIRPDRNGLGLRHRHAPFRFRGRERTLFEACVFINR